MQSDLLLHGGMWDILWGGGGGGWGLQKDGKKGTCKAAFALFEIFCLGYFYLV